MRGCTPRGLRTTASLDADIGLLANRAHNGLLQLTFPPREHGVNKNES
jgi:hypothetical protein